MPESEDKPFDPGMISRTTAPRITATEVVAVCTFVCVGRCRAVVCPDRTGGRRNSGLVMTLLVVFLRWR